eukprot:gene28548-34460_t
MSASAQVQKTTLPSGETRRWLSESDEERTLKNEDDSVQRACGYLGEDVQGLEPPPVARVFPFFSVCMCLALWLSYVLGLWLNGKDLATVDMTSAISIRSEQVWYYTVTPWPACRDVRSEVWRLLSLQFSHRSILELYSPRGWLVCAVVMQLTMALGTLAFSLSSPYEGLIGASPGGYGLFGGCVALSLIALCFSSSLKMDAACRFVLPPTLLVHAVLEVAMFFVSYQGEVGYVSHWAGALAGLLSGLFILGLQTRASLELRGLAVLCALLLLLAVALGTYARYGHWPPVRLFYVGQPDASCCKGYLAYMQDMPNATGSPTDLGYCQNSQFVPYHST